MNGDVGVEEEDRAGPWRPRRPRLRAAAGPCGRRDADDDRPRPCGDGGRVVGRAVVDDDQLEIGQERVAKPPEAALEVAAPVSHGDHHRERRPPRPRARRTGGDIVHDSPSPVRTRHVPECVSVHGIARTRARDRTATERGDDSPRSRRAAFFRPRRRPSAATCRRTLAGTPPAVNAGRTAPPDGGDAARLRSSFQGFGDRRAGLEGNAVGVSVAHRRYGPLPWQPEATVLGSNSVP